MTWNAPYAFWKVCVVVVFDDDDIFVVVVVVSSHLLTSSSSPLLDQVFHNTLQCPLTKRESKRSLS